jgi:hypothetical protein
MDDQSTNQLIVADVGLPAEIAELAERAKSYAQSAKADSTRKAYDSDWRHFEAWCRARGIESMPAHPIGAVLAYLTAHGRIFKTSTLTRRLVAIRECHRYGGFELDTSSVAFRDTWKGLRREEGRARPTEKKAPLLTATLRRAVLSCRARAFQPRLSWFFKYCFSGTG